MCIRDSYLLGALHGYKVMIAQYTQRVPVLKDDLDFMLWQYTGKGRLDGISGYVDKSRFMGDYNPVSYTHLDVYKRQFPTSL